MTPALFLAFINLVPNLAFGGAPQPQPRTQARTHPIAAAWKSRSRLPSVRDFGELNVVWRVVDIAQRGNWQSFRIGRTREEHIRNMGTIENLSNFLKFGRSSLTPREAHIIFGVFASEQLTGILWAKDTPMEFHARNGSLTAGDRVAVNLYVPDKPPSQTQAIVMSAHPDGSATLLVAGNAGPHSFYLLRGNHDTGQPTWTEKPGMRPAKVGILSIQSTSLEDGNP